MDAMFQSATAFNQNIGGWNTSSVGRMKAMFSNANSFDQNIGSWNVGALTTAENMFANVSLSTSNYDALLDGWNAQTLLSDVEFGGGNSTYCLAKAARANMISSDNWDITDGGENCPLTVTINQGSAQSDPTSSSPIVFDVLFSESVTGFDENDVTITGVAGTAGVTVTGSGATYTASVTGMADGETVTASINANAAQNGGGSDSEASTSTDNSVLYDIAPEVSINQGSAQSDPTSSSPIVFDVLFSELVTGFDENDVTITGVAGTAGVTVVGSGTTYTVSVTGMANGETVTASVDAGAAQDGTGNDSEASTSTDNSVLYDIAPEVTINQGSAQSDPTSSSPIVFDVLFSELVTGFDENDVTITGVAGTAGVTVVGSGTTYTVSVTGMADGETVAASVDAGAAQDGAGNDSEASTSTDNSVLYDIALEVTINQGSAQSDPTNSSPIVFDVLFSELVTGFDENDVTITGVAGTAGVTVVGSGTTYTVSVTGMADGETVAASVDAGAAQDGAGNDSEASTSTDASVTYDETCPTVSSSSPAIGATIESTNTLTVDFSTDMQHGNVPNTDDADNVANYILVEEGDVVGIQTTTCALGAHDDDTEITILSAVYSNNGGSGPYRATLNVESLEDGSYQLLACGSTTLYDLAGNPLNGGTDSAITFTVAAAAKQTEVQPEVLPQTGFTPGVVTELPMQDLSEMYQQFNFVSLEIPSLEVEAPIVGVPVSQDGWGLTWLGDQAGWLHGTAFPSWAGNSAITAHVVDANGEPGLFKNLSKLKWGDEVIVHVYGQAYTYAVRSVEKYVQPDDTSSVFQHEDYPWLTLITCRGYHEESDSYHWRVVIRAVQIKIN